MSARLEPERAAAALGAVNLCWGFGAAIWPLGVAALTKRGSLTAGLAVVSVLLVAMAAWVARAEFPSSPHAARDPRTGRAGSAVRLAIFGACIALYAGTEAAFGGWITEYARRLAGNTASGGWELAATTFWGGLTAGRAGVAIWLVGRLENVAMFTGLAVVAAAILLVITTPAVGVLLVCAAFCGIGLAPIFPVTVAALSREFSTGAAGPMVALGSLGAGTLPLMVGALSDRSGSLTIGLSSLVVSVAVLITLQIMRTRSAGRV